MNTSTIIFNFCFILQIEFLYPGGNIFRGIGSIALIYRKAVGNHFRIGFKLLNGLNRTCKLTSVVNAERNDGFTGKIIFVKKSCTLPGADHTTR